MALLSDESERNQVWVRPFDTASGTAPEGKWRVSKDGAESMIAWRADGKEMYYLHNDVETGDAMVTAVDIATSPSFQPGTPKLLFRLPVSPQENPGPVEERHAGRVAVCVHRTGSAVNRERKFCCCGRSMQAVLRWRRRQQQSRAEQRII
jgi:hypothetical protein